MLSKGKKQKKIECKEHCYEHYNRLRHWYGDHYLKTNIIYTEISFEGDLSIGYTQKTSCV